MIELKSVALADAPIIFESWGRHAPNFRYLTAGVFAAVGDAERYIASLHQNPASKAFHIIDAHGRVVGIVKALVSEHRAQVGYVVHEPFWGKGIATAAVGEMTRRLEATPEISRIWATCALDNRASARVLEKNGYQREGILKNWVIYPAQGGRAFDNYSYVRVPTVARLRHP